MLDMGGETWILQAEESDSRYVYSIKKKNKYLPCFKEKTLLLHLQQCQCCLNNPTMERVVF